MIWKIGSLTDQSLEVQKKVWAEIAKKLSLDLQFAEVPAEILADPIENLKNLEGFNALILSPALADEFLEVWPKVPAEVVEAGFSDVVLFDKKQWWFRCFLKDALKQLIIDSAPQLDTHSFVYVTGSDNQTRLCASVAIHMGFRKIVFVAKDQDAVRYLVDRLQKMFFDLSVKVIRDTELTLQPNNGSLLLNTIAADSGEAILDDLPYLNFLKKEGLVVDLPFPAGLQQLQEEAAHVGIRHLNGFDLGVRRDYLFLQNLLGPAFSLSREEHLQIWKSSSETKTE